MCVEILFSVKALSKVFRAKFCEKLKATLKDKFNENQENEYKKKSEKSGGKTLGSFTLKSHLEAKICGRIFGRYTHKIAISNHRIRNIDAENVTFDYKDYRQKV